jgi:hypothetical protein
VHLKDILNKKLQGMFTKGVSFLHINATGHRALATQCRVHPHYSLDLVSSDYHLFPGLKKRLKIAIFLPIWKSLLLRRLDWTDNLLNLFSLGGFQIWSKRAKKCTELRAEKV